MVNPNLRNRANDRDRPKDTLELRQIKFTDARAKACKAAGGHDHIFQRFDRYGCCTRCGDEVLT